MFAIVGIVIISILTCIDWNYIILRLGYDNLNITKLVDGFISDLLESIIWMEYREIKQGGIVGRLKGLFLSN